jgi:ligand-binding sensor domain-containing protein
MFLLHHKIYFFAIAVLFLCFQIFAVGQSAVITLVFPPGARATGLGEAFTAIADDANATYFNPAGLGQSPLANSWKNFSANKDLIITSITSKKKKELSTQDKIWLGTNKGLFKFNGKSWLEYERYLIVQGDNLESIAKKYINTDNDELIKKAIKVIKDYNKLESNRKKMLKEYLQKEITDSILQVKKYSIDSLVDEILDMSKSDRTPPKIYAKISNKIDSAKAYNMSDNISLILQKKDIQLEDLVELKIPYTISVKDTINCLLLDSLERLWIGTNSGLWRFDGSVFKYFSETDGLPSNKILCLTTNSSNDIAVGTDSGIALYSDGKWSKLEIKDNVKTPVFSLAYGKNKELYIGTQNGLFIKKDSEWNNFDTSNGLFTNDVLALFVDSKSRVWVGGKDGICILEENSLKRYKFPQTIVTSFTEHSNGVVWIGTQNGAISYKSGKKKTDSSGKIKESPPEWKVFHSKNALLGNDVTGITTHGNDVWISTKNGINKYDYAERQVFLFYEQLLPAFKIPDLWHAYLSGIIPTEDWGTLGVFVNFINFGINQMTDEQGREIAQFRSWEGVFGLSYGLLLAEDLSAGVNIKYAHSALAPGYGPGDEGIGRTFAIDASILKRNLFINNFDIGFMLQNMGPSIFYISREEADPIPFTIRLGLAYKAIQTPYLDLKILFDADREIVKNYPDKRPDPFYKAIWTGFLNDTTLTFREKMEEINLHGGIELWYANLLALRLGHLFDYAGRRFELTIGFGINYANLNFDWSFIYSPEGFMKGIVLDGSNGSRHGQWRASFIFNF